MRWASLTAWKDRGDGWFAHPDYGSMLRSRDGRWWIKTDIDEGKVEMTPTARGVRPGGSSSRPTPSAGCTNGSRRRRSRRSVDAWRR